eukprot:TRINITY_DN966_c0_g1_i1.p1 TRINITY_DN966_c0_g1~~TRINITY_DN966_c0_g1_i1.p1  ORF type:complete len:439 (-),score=101.29 TRINITY_DN966_c0_g1_i1:167-1483(-)
MFLRLSLLKSLTKVASRQHVFRRFATAAAPAAPAKKKEPTPEDLTKSDAPKEISGIDRNEPWTSPYDDDRTKPVKFHVDWPPTLPQMRALKAHVTSIVTEGGSKEAFFDQYVYRKPGIIEPDTTNTVQPKYPLAPVTLEDAKERGEPIRCAPLPYQDCINIKTPKPYYVLEPVYRTDYSRKVKMLQTVGMFGKYSWFPMIGVYFYLVYCTELVNIETISEFTWCIPGISVAVYGINQLVKNSAYKPHVLINNFREDFNNYRLDALKRYLFLESFNISHPKDVRALMNEDNRIAKLAEETRVLNSKLEIRKQILQKLNAIFSLEREQDSMKKDAMLEAVTQFITQAYPKLERSVRTNVIETAITAIGESDASAKQQKLSTLRTTVDRLFSAFFDMRLTSEQLGVEDRILRLLETEPKEVRDIVYAAMQKAADEDKLKTA